MPDAILLIVNAITTESKSEVFLNKLKIIFMTLYFIKNVIYFIKIDSLFNYYSTFYSYRVQKVRYLFKKCQKF
jgi:hypothetical protein